MEDLYAQTILFSSNIELVKFQLRHKTLLKVKFLTFQYEENTSNILNISPLKLFGFMSSAKK